MPSNTARIAKNTLMLYFRQILIMLVSLYTVRVVLNTLGAEDYGIYNVVAGVVTMFGFLSNSMASASQRYFSFEIGRNDYEQLEKTFSLSLTIYLFIGLLILLLAETIGLWFVNNKLVIPVARIGAARWIYQFAILSFLLTMITTPYMASVIAHENMSVYAYVSILEATLRLLIVYILQMIAVDKLKLYGLLMFAVTFVNTGIYRFLCAKRYKECGFRFYWNRELFKGIIGFTGWSMFGSLTGIIRNQAVTILLNQFFNPVTVAARGIALQINGAVSSFSQNFSTALQPQIVKTYSAGEKERMFRLIADGARTTWFLLFLFALPLVLEMPFVLALWLKNPPEYTVVFTRLAVIDVLVNSISLPLMTAARAPGKMKLYESVLGSIQICCFVLTWIALILGAPAESSMLVSIGISGVMFFARLLIVRKLISYPLRYFFHKALVPVCAVTAAAAALPVAAYILLKQSLIRFCIVTPASVVSACFWMYVIGLNAAERIQIKRLLRRKLERFHKKYE
jgi:O-antigen/teichoic acid export membrane protein